MREVREGRYMKEQKEEEEERKDYMESKVIRQKIKKSV